MHLAMLLETVMDGITLLSLNEVKMIQGRSAKYFMGVVATWVGDSWTLRKQESSWDQLEPTWDKLGANLKLRLQQLIKKFKKFNIYTYMLYIYITSCINDHNVWMYVYIYIYIYCKRSIFLATYFLLYIFLQHSASAKSQLSHDSAALGPGCPREW